MVCTGVAERIWLWVAILTRKVFFYDNNLPSSDRIRLARLFPENREAWKKKLPFHYKEHISQRFRVNWL